MSDFLHGVGPKVARARFHRRAIQRECERFRKSQIGPILAEIDPDTGEQVWRMGGEPA